MSQPDCPHIFIQCLILHINTLTFPFPHGCPPSSFLLPFYFLLFCCFNFIQSFNFSFYLFYVPQHHTNITLKTCVQTDPLFPSKENIMYVADCPCFSTLLQLATVCLMKCSYLAIFLHKLESQGEILHTVGMGWERNGTTFHQFVQKLKD